VHVTVETGIVLWGNESLLLQGVSSLEYLRFGGRDLLLAGSGAVGAITAFDVTPGSATLVTGEILYDTESGTRALSDMVVLREAGAVNILTLGRYDDNFGYAALSTTGVLGDPQPLSGAEGSFAYGLVGEEVRLNNKSLAFVAGNGGAGIQIYEVWRGQLPRYVGTRADTDWAVAGDIRAMHATHVGNYRFLFAGSGLENGIMVYRILPEGVLNVRGRHIPKDGGGYSDITDLDSVEVGGRQFLVLSAAGTDSLVVLRVSLNLDLTFIDNFIDTNATRIANVQAIAAFKIGERAFVAAAGGDDGVSLFEITERGALVHLATVADDFDLALDNVSDLEVRVSGTVAHIYASSPTEHGITELTVDLGLSGRVIRGGPVPDILIGTDGDDIIWGNGRKDRIDAGAGDDVLIDGTGKDRLTGGPGADIFTFKRDGRIDIIEDFEIGIDRIDLSDWDRLYDISSLTIAPRKLGAIIFIGEEILRVRSAEGGEIDPDLFTNDMFIFG